MPAKNVRASRNFATADALEMEHEVLFPQLYDRMKEVFCLQLQSSHSGFLSFIKLSILTLISAILALVSASDFAAWL